MSEVQSEPKQKSEQKFSIQSYEVIKTVYCKCGREIGEEALVDGAPVIRLFASEFLLVAAHGICGWCGEEFHWTKSDNLLKRILERASK